MWVEGAGVDDFVYDDFQEGSEDCGEPGRLGCRCFGWMDGYGSIMIVHVDVKRLILLRFSNFFSKSNVLGIVSSLNPLDA